MMLTFLGKTPESEILFQSVKICTFALQNMTLLHTLLISFKKRLSVMFKVKFKEELRKHMSLRIIGTGSYLPDNIVTNEDLAKIVDTSDEWITTRTGIKQRYISKDMTTSQLATKAAEKALQNAHISAEDLGYIICATISADTAVPSMAANVQHAIGASCPAFDINAACTGFIYGLKIAEGLFSTTDKPILVIGAECLSQITDWKDRATCVLFGDGAGAAVLAPGDDMLYCEIRNTPDPNGYLYVPGINQKKDGESQTVDPSYIQMNGIEVYKFAKNAVSSHSKEALKKTGLTPQDLKYVVPHQANSRIISAAADILELSMDHFFVNIDQTGNTSAASIPIALDQMNQAHMMERGDKLLLVGFGGGFTSGAAIIRW